MLKDISENPDEQEFAKTWDTDGDVPEQQAGKTGARLVERECARFRAVLWLGLAADIRRRASQEMKGMVSC